MGGPGSGRRAGSGGKNKLAQFHADKATFFKSRSK